MSDTIKPGDKVRANSDYGTGMTYRVKSVYDGPSEKMAVLTLDTGVSTDIHLHLSLLTKVR